MFDISDSELIMLYRENNEEALDILNQKYNITEADFLSSEIEVVPAFKARSLGFDGSMVAAYGQDDKICAYTSLSAMMSLETVSA